MANFDGLAIVDIGGLNGRLANFISPPRLLHDSHPDWSGRPRTAAWNTSKTARSLPPSPFNTTLDDVTPANGKFSLREAISKANSTPGADTIVVPAGIYKITIPGAGESANATGDFNITDGVTIQGAGRACPSSTAINSTGCSTFSEAGRVRSRPCSRASRFAMAR